MPSAREKKRRTRSGRSSSSNPRRANRARGSHARGSSRGPSKLKYSKWIESSNEHEERQGQSLATRNHDVILEWAEERQAVPSIVGGSTAGNGIGVLRLDFPGYSGDRLKKVDWDEWFRTFDKNSLTFLFQEHKRDGSRSNFFKLSRLK